MRIAGADKPTHELTEAEWDTVQAVNVKGVFFCTKHAISHLRAAEALHPLGHLGEPDDVAYGILYLASNESTFLSGIQLVIDGGYTAR